MATCMQKRHPQRMPFRWRRVRDSNPRAIARKLISSQPRYDHFDNSPYSVVHKILLYGRLPAGAPLCPVAVPEIFCSLTLTRFRPLPLLIVRFICHRQRSQTSPLRYRCIYGSAFASLCIIPHFFVPCNHIWAHIFRLPCIFFKGKGALIR